MSHLWIESCYVYEWAISLMWNEPCHIYEKDMPREREKERNKEGREEATPDSYDTCQRLVLSGILVTNIYRRETRHTWKLSRVTDAKGWCRLQHLLHTYIWPRYATPLKLTRVTHTKGSSRLAYLLKTSGVLSRMWGSHVAYMSETCRISLHVSLARIGIHIRRDLSLVTHSPSNKTYGVATISRLLKIIGIFCKRAL